MTKPLTMKFNTSMPKKLVPHFNHELKQYQLYFEEGQLQSAWRHLERAHIIGQKYPWTHSLVHWKMLLFGFKIKSPKEIFGQILRLFTGGVKSFVGKIPVGNPGGANVPPLKSFPIPDEIQIVLAKAEVN